MAGNIPSLLHDCTKALLVFRIFALLQINEVNRLCCLAAEAEAFKSVILLFIGTSVKTFFRENQKPVLSGVEGADPLFFCRKRLNLQLSAEASKKGRKRDAPSPFVRQNELQFMPCGLFSALTPRSQLLLRQYYFLFHYFHS